MHWTKKKSNVSMPSCAVLNVSHVWVCGVKGVGSEKGAGNVLWETGR